MRLRKRRIVLVTGRETTEREDVLDALRVRQGVAAALSASGYETMFFDVTPEDCADFDALGRRLAALSADCVFNLFEGFSADAGVEVPFCALLESLGVPFTGNASGALALCLDKERAKRLLMLAGVPVPKGFCVCGELRGPVPALAFPVFCKPCCEDGSVGIGEDAIARSSDELLALLEKLLPAFPRGVLVEEFIGGTEYNAGFVGNGSFELLAVSKLDYDRYPRCAPYLGYDAKWNPASVAYQAMTPEIERGIGRERRREVARLARRAGKALGCRGYFRVDVRERGGRLYVLDVNPNPDLDAASGFARQSAYAGYSYPEIVAKLVRLALRRRERGERHGRRAHFALSRYGEAECRLSR